MSENVKYYKLGLTTNFIYSYILVKMLSYNTQYVISLVSLDVLKQSLSLAFYFAPYYKKGTIFANTHKPIHVNILAAFNRIDSFYILILVSILMYIALELGFFICLCVCT
jgi:hypothetical protein